MRASLTSAANKSTVSESAAEIDVEAARAAREAAERDLAAASTLPVEETDPIRERIREYEAKLQLATGR